MTRMVPSQKMPNFSVSVRNVPDVVDTIGFTATALSIVALYAVLRLQFALPFNPHSLPAVSPDLALNTAVSFVTNTSWQSYAGETTLSYLSQMAGITVHSFLSAASGMAVAIALIRGFARRRSSTIGNYWVDLTRGTLYVLLPICVLAALFLITQGVPQPLAPSIESATLEGATQTIARGPVASQEAIKLLSGDGGGFFNANSAHPFENPSPLTNFVELVLIFVLGAALTNCFGRMIGSEREGWTLLAVMAILFALGVSAIYAIEARGNPALAFVQPEQYAAEKVAAGNMEGKEVRFGITASALFANVSTASSDGAVNSMHDSFMPLSGGILLANMMVDEVIVGAPGSGLFGMLLFCIVAVFLAGLMIGRTPEYVGKKIRSSEVKMTLLALIAVPLATLGLTGVACVVEPGLAGLGNSGPHGFSEILNAYTSSASYKRQRFRRFECQFAVLQSDARARYVRWPLLRRHSGFGNCRVARRADRHSALKRHAAHRRRAVCLVSARCDRDRRRLDLFAGPGARPNRRAPAVNDRRIELDQQVGSEFRTSNCAFPSVNSEV
jgi:potassium-transporting ATPase potassium-binding subunit